MRSSHDMPIVPMTRQNGPAVEGIERYNTGEDRIKVKLLAVDTVVTPSRPCPWPSC